VIPDGVGGRMDGRTDGQTLPDFMTAGTFVSPTYQSPFLPQGYSWYSFLLEAESTPEPQCGRIMSMKNSNDTIVNRPHNLPARSAVLQVCCLDLRKGTASVKFICLHTT
jgi:hypothetical protein